MARVDVALRPAEDGWIADVTVHDAATTTHVVCVTRRDHERYGDGDGADLVRRSFAFLLAREPNTSIPREFSLSTIERCFPEFPDRIRT